MSRKVNSVDGALHISVKTPAGQTISLKSKLGDSIGSVKGKVWEKEGIPAERQRLFFNNIHLQQDSHTLGDYVQCAQGERSGEITLLLSVESALHGKVPLQPWSLLTRAVIGFGHLQMLAWYPEALHGVLFLVSSLVVLMCNCSLIWLGIPLALALLVHRSERWVTGRLRYLVFGAICLTPPCDPRADPLVQQLRNSNALPSTPRPMSTQQAALVTGATGFAGMYLLRELVRRHPERNIVVLSRHSRNVTLAKIRRCCARYGVPEFPLDNVTVTFGDFKKTNLGSSLVQLDAVWSQIGVVYHYAMSTSYIVPYECMRFWSHNVDLLCRLCLQHGVQLHAMGGSGSHVVEDTPVPESKIRSIWCNGYFYFKLFQRELMSKYVERGMFGCTYDAPYITADVALPAATTPVDYEVAVAFKFGRTYGLPPTLAEMTVITADGLACVLAEHAERARAMRQMECSYMNLFIKAFPVCACVQRNGVTITGSRQEVIDNIQKSASNPGLMCQLLDVLVPEFVNTVQMRPRSGPRWTAELLDKYDAEAVCDKYLQQVDAAKLTIAGLSDECFGVHNASCH
eukprot:m.161115 g.161115  ORF g.161115 m.161115 type:complete len:571 (+) comp20960_c0_seq1:288-2000(+)